MGARHRSPLGSHQSPFAFALRVPNLLLHLVNQPHQGIERAHVDVTLAMMLARDPQHAVPLEVAKRESAGIAAQHDDIAGT